VEIEARHCGFAVHRPALERVVAEIATFVAEAEGQCPAVPYGRCL
jgi:hypothetical protein